MGVVHQNGTFAERSFTSSMLKPTKRPTQSPWLVGLVAAVVLLADVFWKPRPELQQAIRSNCSGVPVRLSQRDSAGFGDGTWWERSVYICLPDYVRSADSYIIEGTDRQPVTVTKEKTWWPYFIVLSTTVWAGIALWTSLNRPRNGAGQ